MVCLQLFFSFHISISKLKIDTARYAAALPTYAQCLTSTIYLELFILVSHLLVPISLPLALVQLNSSVFKLIRIYWTEEGGSITHRFIKTMGTWPKAPRVAMAQTCRNYMQATKLLHFCRTNLSASLSTYILVQWSLRTDKFLPLPSQENQVLTVLWSINM